MRTPHAFSARTINSPPSSASRTAAVAKARTFFTLEDAGDGAKARQRRERAIDSLAAELAGRRDGAAETAQHFLVEQRRRRAHGALVHDEAHRIRADIDDADGLELVNPVLLAEQPFQARQVQPLIRL